MNWDYLIVGGGSAGCVLANRLSATGASVLLMEAGVDTPPARVPHDVSDTYPRSYANPDYQWPDLKADMGTLGNANYVPFPQARVMGGGSSINGMISLRGLSVDYDEWAGMGLDGWAWRDVLPYFRRLETDADFTGDMHGDVGPVSLRRHFREDWPAFIRSIALAASARGYRYIEDLNGSDEDGFGPFPLSNTHQRVSAAAAYLDSQTRQRPNLCIMDRTTVHRLLMVGARCVGVVAMQDQREIEFRAAHTVVAAGGVYSPAILMRSGIGPARALQRLGIPVVVQSEGVGANLQNHPIVYLAAHIRKEARQSPVLRPLFLAGLRFSSNSNPDMTGDMQMMFLNKSSWHGIGQSIGALGVILSRPFSRGAVTLTSAQPTVPPDVRFNLLLDERDATRMINGLGLAVALLQDPAVRALRNEMFAQGYSEVIRRLNRPTRRNALIAALASHVLDGPGWIRGPLMHRLTGSDDATESSMFGDTWLKAIVASRATGTCHPVGTCRMGVDDDPMAVLDARCAVRGASGLSVVDASSMPIICRGNTNIPTIMLAERASDLIIERYAARQDKRNSLCEADIPA